jgi:hypothetical protein
MYNIDELIELRTLDMDTYKRVYYQMKKGYIERIVIDGRLYCRKEDINKDFRHRRGRKAKQ